MGIGYLFILVGLILMFGYIKVWNKVIFFFLKFCCIYIKKVVKNMKVCLKLIVDNLNIFGVGVCVLYLKCVRGYDRSYFVRR